MESWYVVHTQAHGEARAQRHLQNQAYEVYLPRYRKRRRHAGRIETVFRPLFPRYLFVRIDLGAQRWVSINSTAGVHALVCAGQDPIPLPDRVVTDIKAREDADGVIALLPKRMRRGQAVTIVDGPFADLSALFEESLDRDRVVLLLTLLGRPVKVRVPSAAVMPG